MKRKTFLLIGFLFLFLTKNFAQYQNSGSCENILEGGANPTQSVFKLQTYCGDCTGTLVNRDIDQNSLGQYFITAWHCFKTGTNCGGDKFDFDNNYVEFYFNYSSPTSSYSNVPSSNQGINDGPSNPYGYNGYEYYFTSKVRLVDHVDCALGDFALCEILDPIPPHFNIYYSGWSPSPLAVNLESPFTLIHHPKEDIKMISGTSVVYSVNNVIAVDCRIITTIIDDLFGWLWGNSVSTQVICNYVDYNYYIVPHWDEGGAEEGTSGSALFNNNWRIKATFSTGGGCSTLNTSTLPKFSSNYLYETIKNTLNPNNYWSVDNFGIDGRKITCYPTLTLGDPNVATYYFPANHYQPNNHIELSSETDITTQGNLTILTGADYELNAGNSIHLNPGFVAQSGSTFKTVIQSCNISSKQANANNNVIPVLPKLPNKLVFNEDSVLSKNVNSNNSNFYVKVYPNPNNGIMNVTYSIPANGKGIFNVYDVLGNKALSYPIFEGLNTFTIYGSKLIGGVYSYQMIINDKIVAKDKIVVIK